MGKISPAKKVRRMIKEPPKLHWWQVALLLVAYPVYACLAAGIALWSVWEILKLKHLGKGGNHGSKTNPL